MGNRPVNEVCDCLEIYRQRANQALDRCLPVFDAPSQGANPDSSNNLTVLPEAMRYCVTNGGKRIRPALTYATGSGMGIDLDRLDIPACSLELMHAYSLVHDDLPAMDNDDLRRGLPTCHRKYDEATAILAGDALQALAFTMLASNDDAAISAENKTAMIQLLGDASGASGMAAGQAIDLASVGKNLSLQQLEEMHRYKTGALINASIMMATCAAPARDDEFNQHLSQFADELGLLFQIVDDILDVVSDTQTLGKPQGADKALNKPTYPALLGLEGARQHASDIHSQALSHLDQLGSGFSELRDISNFVIKRSH